MSQLFVTDGCFRTRDGCHGRVLGRSLGRGVVLAPMKPTTTFTDPVFTPPPYPPRARGGSFLTRHPQAL